MMQNLLVAKVNGAVVGQVSAKLHQDRVAVLQLLKRNLPKTLGLVPIDVQVLAAFPKAVPSWKIS